MWNHRTFHAGRLDFFARNTVAGGYLTCHGKDVQVQKEEKDDELKTSFLVQELWYLILFAC